MLDLNPLGEHKHQIPQTPLQWDDHVALCLLDEKVELPILNCNNTPLQVTVLHLIFKYHKLNLLTTSIKSTRFAENRPL